MWTGVHCARERGGEIGFRTVISTADGDEAQHSQAIEKRAPICQMSLHRLYASDETEDIRPVLVSVGRIRALSRIVGKESA